MSKNKNGILKYVRIALAPLIIAQVVLLILHMSELINWPWWLLLGPFWACLIVAIVFYYISKRYVVEYDEDEGLYDYYEPSKKHKREDYLRSLIEPTPRQESLSGNALYWLSETNQFIDRRGNLMEFPPIDYETATYVSNVWWNIAQIEFGAAHQIDPSDVNIFWRVVFICDEESMEAFNADPMAYAGSYLGLDFDGDTMCIVRADGSVSTQVVTGIL